MRRSLVMAALGGVLACTDITEPHRTPPHLSIRDGAHEAGNRHFYFLPPLVALPTVSGDFDASLDPGVLICEWGGNACGPLVAAFTSAGGTGSEAVRVDAVAEHYVVNWHTDQSTLDPAKTYRIFVSVAGTALGHADVDVVGSGRELRSVNTGEFIGLVNGRTLPIKFRIEVGAVFVAGPGADTISAAGGQVSLAMPAGALTTPTGITVEPAVSVPGDPRVAAGTGYDFGPDGLVFQQPVTLTIRYDPSQLGAGVTEASLRLHKVVNGGLVEVAGSTVDMVANTVGGQIGGFSTYVAAQGGSVSFSTSVAGGARGIWGSGPADVFAVNYGGVIRRFDGSTWSTMSSGTTLDLEAVWGSGPSNVYAAGDGVILRYNGSSWSPVLNNVRATGGACHVTAGDLNGDGHGDVVQVNHGDMGGDIQVLLGTGTGAFVPHTTIPGAVSSGTQCIVQLERLDANASPDLIYHTTTGFVIRLGDGSGGFGTPLAHSVPLAGHPASGDLNNDGNRDLVLPIWTGTTPFVGVMLGDGSGGMSAPMLTSISTAAYIIDLAVADLNGDNRSDVAVVRQGEPQALVALATSGGALGPWTPYALLGEPKALALSDVTGDANVDLVVAQATGVGTYGSVAVAPGNGGGTFGGFAEHSSGPAPYDVMVADVNGDAVTDLITSDSWNVLVALGTGGGSFGPLTAFASPHDCSAGQLCISAIDVTGDGRPEAITTRAYVGFAVLPNLGNGTFQPAPFFNAVWGASPNDVYAVGGGAVMHYDGSTWSVANASSVPETDHKAVWGASATAVFVGGNRGRVLFYNGSGWTSSAPLDPFTIRSLWGTSSNDVYAAAGGELFRFDGTQWALVAIPVPPSLNNYVDWHGVWGTSPSDLYVVGWEAGGAAGRIAYFNGVTWLWLLALDEGPAEMRSVWGSSSNDVWVAGRFEILRGTR